MTAASRVVPTSSAAEPSSSAATAPSLATLAGLNDVELAQWLERQKKNGNGVVLVHAGTTCKVYEKADTRALLLCVDPEGKAKSAFKALAKKELLFIVEISTSEMADATTADATWHPERTSVEDVEVFLEKRKVHLGRVGGRGDPITANTANQVWADAGGCCMFKGCGADLSNVPLYNAGARIAYLAHIIASDPQGPRGTDDSHLLANHPENIMLMCDAHHRLIDSFAPELFKAPRLQEMRREHTSKVRKYRAAMQYPEAQVMTLFADLGNIPTYFPDSAFMEALLAEGFSMRPEVKRYLTYQLRDERTSPDFWGNYLREMQLPIAHMVQDVGRVPTSSLAVFPIHHTPTLVLAGRIVGEARKVVVFQRSRRRQSWLWNQEDAPHPAGTFKVVGLTDTHVNDVVLTVELTARLDERALPAELSEAVTRGDMPWIRLTTDNPNGECIQRKEDLAQVVDAAREAINSIQDRMRASCVRLIVLSPASAAFSIGQLMQVGHHATFVLYDRPNGDHPFREAFTINGHSVIPPAGSTQPPISIR